MDLEWFINKGRLVKDPTSVRLSAAYMRKAWNNIVTMELLSSSKNHKAELEIPKDYEPSEWVVIAAYYAMYVAALAVLAKLGYRSKNHTATVKALDAFLVKRQLMDKSYIMVLNQMKLEIEDLGALSTARDRREVAQYSVTKQTTTQIADDARKSARTFVEKMEDLLESLS